MSVRVNTWIKRIGKIILLSCACLSFTVISDDASKDKNGDSGKITSEAHDLKPFTAVSLSGIGNLHIKQSTEQGFTVEAEKSLLPLVIVYVKDKTLYIDLKNAADHTDAKIDYYLNIKELVKVDSFSTSTVYITNNFSGNELTVTLNGLGEADMSIDMKKLILNINGGSKVIASGNANEQAIAITGAGEYKGGKLSGQTGSVSIAGSGLANVHISDNLTIKISGEGVVNYCGTPTITKDISGKGIVTPLDEGQCHL